VLKGDSCAFEIEIPLLPFSM